MTEESKAKTLIEEARELLKHAAPGPWEARTTYVYHFNAKDRAARTKPYTVCGVSLPGANEMLAATGSYGDMARAQKIRDSNAALIARAPDLLSQFSDELDQQVSQNETQAQNIRHLQEQYRVMKEAIEAADGLIVKLYDEEVIPVLMQYEVDGVRSKLRNSITPKGEQSS